MPTNEELKEEYGLTVQQVNALDEARADEREQLSDSPTHDDWVRKQERQKFTELLQEALSKLETEIQKNKKSRYGSYDVAWRESAKEFIKTELIAKLVEGLK